MVMNAAPADLACWSKRIAEYNRPLEIEHKFSD